METSLDNSVLPGSKNELYIGPTTFLVCVTIQDPETLAFAQMDNIVWGRCYANQELFSYITGDPTTRGPCTTTK